MLFFAVLEDLPSSMKMNCSFWIICIESDFLRWGYCYKSANGFVVLIKVISFVIVLSLPLWIATPRLHTATCSLLRAMMSTWYASPRVVTSWLAGFQWLWLVHHMCSRGSCPSNGFLVVVFEKTTSWDKLKYFCIHHDEWTQTLFHDALLLCNPPSADVSIELYLILFVQFYRP